LIVESHPSLIGDSALRFRELLGATAFEVAIGLETIHPEVLPRLNKRMTTEGFAGAARMLKRNGIDVRAFVLGGLPFVGRRESIAWAKKSIAFAFDAGADVVSLIPTRIGTAALERLAIEGLFTLPDLEMLQEISASGMGRGRLFVDTWDLKRFSLCELCFQDRLHRLERQNLSQVAEPVLPCAACGKSR
jgi:radical SAM enzyme (TIGR01210 family)